MASGEPNADAKALGAGILQSFEEWDINKDGSIDHEELKTLFGELGMQDTDAEAVIAHADTNENGKIEYGEFLEWLFSDGSDHVVGRMQFDGMLCEDGHPMVPFSPDVDGWCCNDCGEDIQPRSYCLQCETCANMTWCNKCILRRQSIDNVAYASAAIKKEKAMATQAEAEADIPRLLGDLFSLYDVDGDGEIQCAEFVDAQDIVLAEKGPQENADMAGSIGQFSELTAAGPLRMDSFADWQNRRLAECHDSAGDKIADVEERITLIRQKRSAKQDRIKNDPAVDKELGDAKKRLRELRKKRPRNLAEEQELLQHMREIWSKRRQEFGGKLILCGSVQSAGKAISGVTIELHSAGQLVCSTTTVEGMFELSTKAQLGCRMTITARKSGFAHVTKHVGGEGRRKILFNLLPVDICEKINAEPGTRDMVEFTHEGAKFALPVGELLKDGEPFTGEAEFGAKIIDHSSGAAPSLCGRSHTGAMLPFQTMGTAYVSLRDPSDGKELKMKPDGRGIHVNVSSTGALPGRVPSVWRYDESTGAWQQTFQPLVLNGTELDTPESECLPDHLDDGQKQQVIEDGLIEEQKSLNSELQGGREALDEQRRQNGEDKACTCGFKAKEAIMAMVRSEARFDLALADPPKRVFAGTSQNASGALSFEFPYLTDEEKASSAELASQNSEVVLSHHVAVSNRMMTTRSHIEMKLPRTKYFVGPARESLPSLIQVIEFLLAGARVEDKTTNEVIDDMDWSFIHLTVLQKLASFWIQGTNDTPCPTLAELKEALQQYEFPSTGPDANAVAEALLSAAARQALLEDVARVRQILRYRDHRHTAIFSEVERALERAEGDVDSAVSFLCDDPDVTARMKKVEVREKLYNKFPMAKPTSRQLEEVLAATDGDLDQAAGMLKDNPEVQQGAKVRYDEIKDTFNEASSTNNFSWEIMDPGYTSLGSYVDLEGAIKEYGEERVKLEFFPAEPERLCPIGDTSMALGVFDEGVFASNVTAVNLDYPGVNFSEEVQPDGAFCLTTFARGKFEVHTTKQDGLPSFSYGPFYGNGRFADLRQNQMIHLGVLGPHRDDGLSWDEVATDVQVVLPALVFEPGDNPEEQRSGRQYADYLGEWSFEFEGQEASEEECEEAEDPREEFDPRGRRDQRKRFAVRKGTFVIEKIEEAWGKKGRQMMLNMKIGGSGKTISMRHKTGIKHPGLVFEYTADGHDKLEEQRCCLMENIACHQHKTAEAFERGNAQEAESMRAVAGQLKAKLLELELELPAELRLQPDPSPKKSQPNIPRLHYVAFYETEDHFVRKAGKVSCHKGEENRGRRCLVMEFFNHLSNVREERPTIYNLAPCTREEDAKLACYAKKIVERCTCFD